MRKPDSREGVGLPFFVVGGRLCPMCFGGIASWQIEVFVVRDGCFCPVGRKNPSHEANIFGLRDEYVRLVG